jgi:hypothetical protein
LLAAVACSGSSNSTHQSTGTTAPPAPATPAGSHPTRPLLFVQQAQQGSFEPVAGQDGVYTLTLRGADPKVLYFSDRPERDAGTLSVDTMLEALGYAKGDPPPNAAIQITDGAAEANVRAVELLNPSYDAQSRTMTYQAHPLDKWTKPGMASLASDVDGAIPTQFDRVTLFIDDALHTCTVEVSNVAAQTLESAGSSMGEHDSWNPQPTGAIAGTVPGRIYTQEYSSTSGLLRGCSNESTWRYPDGTTIDIKIADPWKDPNTYSCTSSNPSKYKCSDPSGDLKGDALYVIYGISAA